MDGADLVLEYVKALVWPGVVAWAVFSFRRQIASKIGDLKEATTPVGAAKFFDREAKEVEEKTDRAADRQETEGETKVPDIEPSPPAPPAPPDHRPAGGPATSQAKADDRPARQEERHSGSEDDRTAFDIFREHTESLVERIEQEQRFRAVGAAWAQVNELPDFSIAREVATKSGNAAVALAYSDLEKVAAAAWTITHLAPLKRRQSPAGVVSQLVMGGNLDSEFLEIAQRLTRMRNEVAHGDFQVSIEGALDYVAACERLAEVLASNAQSKLRHPSRSLFVREWVNWLERQADTGEPPDEE